jgi:hypothetical protein
MNNPKAHRLSLLLFFPKKSAKHYLDLFQLYSIEKRVTPIGSNVSGDILRFILRRLRFLPSTDAFLREFFQDDWSS